jgi:hypothetical protein
MMAKGFARGPDTWLQSIQAPGTAQLDNGASIHGASTSCRRRPTTAEACVLTLIDEHSGACLALKVATRYRLA